MLPASDSLSNLVALVPAPPGAAICHGGGDCRRVGQDQARTAFQSGNALVAHAAFVAGRLKAQPLKPLYDVLELFAFLRPGRPFVPSAQGLARALSLDLPQTPEESAAALFTVARCLLDEARELPPEMRAALSPLAATLARGGWRWGPLLQNAFGEQAPHGSPIAGMEAWRGLPQWDDEAPVGTPGSQPVTMDESRARLLALVGTPRPEQSAYSEAATYAFGPREDSGAPRIALVEAGTGTGKTLGYLAPASVWAEKNGPGLWISTYTRNLQRQIVQEIAHLYPDPVERAEKAVVRKGRENYLCLLNFEEATKRTALAPGQRSVALGLIARWIGSNTDGDISGAGFPAFLAASLPLSEITDRRGECIYAACPHYRICFIERAVRRARHAPIVIANHALVIAQAASDWLATDQTTDTPPERRLRYVFDEGHHLFDAADSGFAALLSGREMAELRRWIRGPEGRARTRMRGLEERLKDLIADDENAQHALEDAVQAAGALAGEGWMARVTGAAARGPGEIFLSEVYRHVRARSDDRDSFYTLEADAQPMEDETLRAVTELSRALKRIADPLARLSKLLRQAMDEKSATLEPYTRARLEAAARGLDRRAKLVLPTWMRMLENLETGEISDDFTDWFEISREEGRDSDIGFERHWIDPTIPLASEILEPAHGALITSATLRDASAEGLDWQSAEVRTGALHLPQPPRRASFGSPFRYDEQSRIFVV
ncbi:MAG: ATP-dependent DNA helicase, partial [Rhizomicrobium sp.]